MINNNSTSGSDAGKLIGLIFLALLWIWLVYVLFTGAGINFKNIFIAVASGIIIFVPLWKRYVQPILSSRRRK